MKHHKFKFLKYLLRAICFVSLYFTGGVLLAQNFDKIPYQYKNKNQVAGYISCVATVDDGRNSYEITGAEYGKSIVVGEGSDLKVQLSIESIFEVALIGGVLDFKDLKGTNDLERGTLLRNKAKYASASFPVKASNKSRSGKFIVECEVVAKNDSERKSKEIIIEIPYKFIPVGGEKLTEADKLYNEITASSFEQKSITQKIEKYLAFLNVEKTGSVRRGVIETKLESNYQELYRQAITCEKLKSFKQKHPKSESYGGFISKATRKENELNCNEEDKERTKSTIEYSEKQVNSEWKKTKEIDSEVAYSNFIDEYGESVYSAEYVKEARNRIQEISNKDNAALAKLSSILETDNSDEDKCQACLDALNKEPTSHFVKTHIKAENNQKKYCKNYIFIVNQKESVNLSIRWDNLKEFDIEVLEREGDKLVKVPEVNLSYKDSLSNGVFSRAYKYLEEGTHRFIVKDKSGKILEEREIEVKITGVGVYNDSNGKIRVKGGNHPLVIQWSAEDKRSGYIDLTKIGQARQRVFNLDDLNLEKGTYVFELFSGGKKIGVSLENVEVAPQKSNAIWIFSSVGVLLVLVFYWFWKKKGARKTKSTNNWSLSALFSKRSSKRKDKITASHSSNLKQSTLKLSLKKNTTFSKSDKEQDVKSKFKEHLNRNKKKNN